MVTISIKNPLPTDPSLTITHLILLPVQPEEYYGVSVSGSYQKDIHVIAVVKPFVSVSLLDIWIILLCLINIDFLCCLCMHFILI